MIEYCPSNVDAETRRRLLADPDAVESSCLEHCGICYATPFLLVDGELRRGEDHEAILEADAEGDE